MRRVGRFVAACLSLAWFSSLTLWSTETPFHSAEFLFPLEARHNHAPGIVECPNGDLLVSWFRGSGERTADDVAVFGARQRKGKGAWSEPFVLADTPGFPDCNTTLFIDRQKRLWLFWPLVIANSWESCLTSYRVAHDYQRAGPIKWDWQGVIPLKPEGLQTKMNLALDEYLRLSPTNAFDGIRLETFRHRIGDKLLNRLGWQPRCKPTVLRSGRIVLPLYSDTYSAGLMALSDDEGKTWFASKPLVGLGNIQPSVLQRNDGRLVAYMRENGPLNKIRVSESQNEGVDWSPVGTIDLPNPGSGLDAVRLHNGHWALVYNDTVKDRKSLAVSVSEDEGRSWRWTRHLEKHTEGSYHYPAIIQDRDGKLHAVYSYFVEAGKAMKHVKFNEAWVQAGDLP